MGAITIQCCNAIINDRSNAMTIDNLFGHFKNDDEECSSMFQRERKKGICLFNLEATDGKMTMSGIAIYCSS
jgi:hypothetical protein